MSVDRDEEDDGYRLEPEETQTQGPQQAPASASAAQVLRKAETDAAAEQEAARSSEDRLKENVGAWWQKAKSLAGGWGQGAKTLAEAGSRKAEAATIRTVSLPKAYAALGRALYEARRYAAEFPQAYSQLDDLMQQFGKLHAQDAAATASLLDRAKQSVRRATDAAAAKALSVRIGHQLQRLGADCFERFGADSGPPDLLAPVQTLLSKLQQLEKKAEKLMAEK